MNANFGLVDPLARRIRKRRERRRALAERARDEMRQWCGGLASLRAAIP